MNSITKSTQCYVFQYSKLGLVNFHVTWNTVTKAHLRLSSVNNIVILHFNSLSLVIYTGLEVLNWLFFLKISIKSFFFSVATQVYYEQFAMKVALDKVLASRWMWSSFFTASSLSIHSFKLISTECAQSLDPSAHWNETRNGNYWVCSNLFFINGGCDFHFI